MKNRKHWPIYLFIFISGVILGGSFHLKIVGENLGSVADWFGAIGTIAAVIVALSTARINEKPSLSFYCEPIKNTSGFTLNVQNNSNKMVCLTSLDATLSKRYILWPVGKSNNRLTNFIDSTIYNQSSSQTLRGMLPEGKDKVLTYFDTISKCYYEVTIRNLSGSFLVETYCSFYSKNLHKLCKILQSMK